MGSWRRLGAAAAAVIVILSGTIAVHAQQLRDRDSTLEASRKIADDLRRARLHYGPFYLLSSIQLADIGYDEQFFVPVANTTSGFRFGLSAPTRLYFTPNRKTYLSVEATPQWSRFGGLSAHNQTGYVTRADAQFLLNHLYLDVYGSQADALHADSGELASLTTRKNREAGANGELKYSSRTSVTFVALTRSESFPLSENKFQPVPEVVLLDRNEHSYRLALVHKTFPLTSLCSRRSTPATPFQTPRSRTRIASTAAPGCSTRAAGPTSAWKAATRSSTSSVQIKRTSRELSAACSSTIASTIAGVSAAAPHATCPSRSSSTTTITWRIS